MQVDSIYIEPFLFIKYILKGGAIMTNVFDLVEKTKLEEYQKNAERLGISLQEYLLLKIAIWCEDNN